MGVEGAKPPIIVRQFKINSKKNNNMWWKICDNIEQNGGFGAFWLAKRYISLKKGAQIKSYLTSHALMTAGFKIWKEIHLYTHQRLTLRILYCKCLNLYLVFVKIYLIRIKCLGGGCSGCIQTASRRCVLKIYWLSRLKIFGPQAFWLACWGLRALRALPMPQQ